jgi:hypothetical protein
MFRHCGRRPRGGINGTACTARSPKLSLGRLGTWPGVRPGLRNTVEPLADVRHAAKGQQGSGTPVASTRNGMCYHVLLIYAYIACCEFAVALRCAVASPTSFCSAHAGSIIGSVLNGHQDSSISSLSIDFRCLRSPRRLSTRWLNGATTLSMWR